MAAWKPELSRNFNIALSDHFGLKHVLDLKVNTEPDEVFSATITVALSADDMAAIAARMGDKGPTSKQETEKPVWQTYQYIDAVGGNECKATIPTMRRTP